MSKGRKGSKRGKGGSRKASKANCCPVIKLKCRMTKPRMATFKWQDPYTGTTKVSKAAVKPHRVCAVALGEKVVTSYGPPNKAGRRINQYRKELAARNCNVKVDATAAKGVSSAAVTKSDVTVTGATPPPAVAERLKGKALRLFTKQLKSMY